MRGWLERELSAMLDAGQMRQVNVEFAGAGASSLDMEALVDLDGSVAPRNRMLNRAVQRILVNACNEHGWVIPFTQVTIHQAPA